VGFLPEEFERLRNRTEGLHFVGWRSGRKDTENNIHSVWFQIKFLEASLVHNVIERDMRGFVGHALAENILDPKNILYELSFANPAKAHLGPSVIERKQAAAPPKQSVLVSNLLQIDSLVHLQSAGVHDYDPSVDCCKVDSVPRQQAVVWRFHRDFNSLRRSIQANGITLAKACGPNFTI